MNILKGAAFVLTGVALLKNAHMPLPTQFPLALPGRPPKPGRVNTSSLDWLIKLDKAITPEIRGQIFAAIEKSLIQHAGAQGGSLIYSLLLKGHENFQKKAHLRFSPAGGRAVSQEVYNLTAVNLDSAWIEDPAQHDIPLAPHKSPSVPTASAIDNDATARSSERKPRTDLTQTIMNTEKEIHKGRQQSFNNATSSAAKTVNGIRFS